MIYQPLDVSRFEARLLRLLNIPSNPLEPPSFETITCSLIRPPEYFALSYCWGDDAQKSTLEVNGEPIHVTKNLAAALRYSGFHPGALIWADAVCINQHDVNEKAHQIRLMGLIYSKAQATAVWLGDEERDTRYARTFLGEIDLDDEDQLNSISGDKFITALKNTRHPVRSLRGLRELLTRPYWERVWIIQEIAKAGTVHVRCGSLCFDLSSVIASTEHVDNLPERSRILISTIQEFRLQESEARRGGLRMTLLQALIRSRYSLATNPRDKVYALLNLARDGNDLVPTPTYSEPIEEVFRELSMTFLQSPHPMEATLLSSRAPLKVRSEAQPPWAVDWSDLAFNMPHWLTSNLSARFNGPLKERGFGAPTFSVGSVKLRGQGQSLGSVDSLGDTWVKPTARLPHEERRNSIATMNWVSSNLYRLFISENSDSQAASCTELTMALAYIIVHADESNTGSGIKSHIKEFLRHLGSLIINSFPIRTWAKGYLDYEESLGPKEVPRPNKDMIYAEPKSRSTNISRFRCFEGPTSPPREGLADSNQLLISAFKVWDDAFTTVNLRPEYGLQFAISGGNIVLVPRATRVGDMIFRLDSCYFPMVLRKVVEKTQTTYKIIGEACIGIGPDRQWIAARDCPWSIKHHMKSIDLVG
ncbi:HET-domain-containing protein [Annulohypoxylon maeteangense]|uniref:HET-domain-containing protein n=1 Tax=Annulohypoxylon maeteangense TaxID=1927788 RepID=UPI0020087B7C|nr:HET-domain-containing protein [Annulohypoxylon maeteangense]KAI0886699.1 HET-domain-containing protein [Annulohypoxylon maeteangense]